MFIKIFVDLYQLSCYKVLFLSGSDVLSCTGLKHTDTASLFGRKMWANQKLLMNKCGPIWHPTLLDFVGFQAIILNLPPPIHLFPLYHKIVTHLFSCRHPHWFLLVIYWHTSPFHVHLVLSLQLFFSSGRNPFCDF